MAHAHRAMFLPWFRLAGSKNDRGAEYIRTSEFSRIVRGRKLTDVDLCLAT